MHFHNPLRQRPDVHVVRSLSVSQVWSCATMQLTTNTLIKSSTLYRLQGKRKIIIQKAAHSPVRKPRNRTTCRSRDETKTIGGLTISCCCPIVPPPSCLLPVDSSRSSWLPWDAASTLSRCSLVMVLMVLLLVFRDALMLWYSFLVVFFPLIFSVLLFLPRPLTMAVHAGPSCTGRRASAACLWPWPAG